MVSFLNTAVSIVKRYSNQKIIFKLTSLGIKTENVSVTFQFPIPTFTSSDTIEKSDFETSVCILVEALADIDQIEKAIDEQVGRLESGHWCCYSCDYVNPVKSTVRAHVESKHVSSSGFQCLTCSRVCPTRHALKMHKLRNKH